MTASPPVVLASGSPRRTMLLAGLGIEHTVDPAHIPEEVLADESPEEHVDRLARAKAVEVASRHPGSLVIAGDTVVVRDGTILGKPADEDEAVAMLTGLSGLTHRVVSGLAVAGPASGALVSRVDTARVTFRHLSAEEIAEYVATGEPLDKAGAYGVQGLGGALVTRVEGDYYTVVGLPVSGLVALLSASGWRYAFGSLRPR